MYVYCSLVLDSGLSRSCHLEMKTGMVSASFQPQGLAIIISQIPNAKNAFTSL